MPKDIENIALIADENKAITAEPTATDDGLVDVELAAHYLDHLPGQTIRVTVPVAASLNDAGYVARR